LRYGPGGGFDAASSASNACISCCVNLGLGAGTGAPRPPPPPEADDDKPVFERLGVGEAPFGP
jgi:hypothetical protein